MQHQSADELVFVDESSTHAAMTPLYARTPRGEGAYAAVPRNKCANFSLLAALSTQVMSAAMTVPGAVGALAFERYAEHVLLPELSRGQTVVMDKLSVYKSARVAQLLHDHGCTLRFPLLLPQPGAH
ncbi:transposase [Deinococcus apachensis]|uniref:transposase n=1 Tax=Deinococcus apachensis TaxID=309886 RepID=UPI0012F7FFDD|nr:transposase [Deinococcus apachensis]